MQAPAPTAGPRFSELGEAGAGPATADGAAGPLPETGGLMSNDAAMEAVKTSPIQQARIQAELSKARLRTLAHQIAQAKHNVV